MAQRSILTDNELRKKLTELGYFPGPITDSTRETYRKFYEKKVATFEDSSISRTSKRSSKQLTHSGADVGQRKTQPLPEEEPVLPLPEDVLTEEGESSVIIASQDSGVSSKYNNGSLHSGIGTCVVTNLLLTLSDPAHPSNDTVLVLGDGSVLSVSRAVLSSQCPKLTSLLYCPQEPFPVNVVTLTGRSCSVYVRECEYVADLKERLSLTRGIPTDEQRLIYSDAELVDTATIAGSRIVRGATIHLVLNTSVDSHTPLLALPSHTPWLSVGHLRVELGLERFRQMVSTQVTSHTVLPSHTSHILHVYDIPRNGLEHFVRLLYCGYLENDSDLSALVVTYVLCVYFELSDLADMCLGVIKTNLSVALAKELLPYSDTIQCQPLKDICAMFV